MTKQPHTTTAKLKAPREAKNASPSSSKRLASWSVPAYRVRRSYGWWVIFLWLFLSVSLLCLIYQSWLTLLVTTLLFTVILIQNLSKAPKQRFTLTHERFLIEYLGKRAREEELILADYSAFTTLEIPATRINPTQWCIALQPKKRFGLTGYATLPRNIEETVAIAQRLEEHMPYVENGGFVVMERFINRASRKLGVR